MFRSFITIAAVAGLVAGASAQQQMPAGSVQKVSNLKYGTYNFNEGFAEATVDNRSGGPGPDKIFDNLSCPAYYYGIIGGPFFKQEWLDEASLKPRGCDKPTEEINGMVWEYCNTELLGAFDAVIALYEDTTPFVGPSIWVNGVAAFPDCLYLVAGLPDGGCWNISLDLSCGFECVLPQKTAGNLIGWSVTPYTQATFHGPILGVNNGCNGNGTSDLFEWRDWTGAYFGGTYTYAGTYFFGGGRKLRGDFRVSFLASPMGTSKEFGARACDTLCLQASNAAQRGAPLGLCVDVTVAGANYVLIIGNKNTVPGDGIPMTAGGTGCEWTRWFDLPTSAIKAIIPFVGAADVTKVALQIPNNVPSCFQVNLQVVCTNGGPGGVTAASNGLKITIQP